MGGIEQRWAPPSETHSRRLIAVVGAMSRRANEHKGTRSLAIVGLPLRR